MKTLLSYLSKALFIITALLAVACLALWGKNKMLAEENDRLSANNETLCDRAEYYETEAGNSAASVQRLELTNAELKAHYQKVCNVADELGVKVKRLKAASTTATNTEVKILTQVRDSIVYRNGALDSLKVIEWCDAWVKVNGELNGDNVALKVVSRDTIHQIVHRVPKKFLFFKWGTKAIRQEVVSSNPHTKITYTEYIELK